MAPQKPTLLHVLEEVIEPLVRADGGRLYVLEASEAVVTLHVAGRFSGCPGNTLAVRGVIEPAVRRVAPEAVLTVTAGVRVPAGASLLGEPPPTSGAAKAPEATTGPKR